MDRDALEREREGLLAEIDAAERALAPARERAVAIEAQLATALPEPRPARSWGWLLPVPALLLTLGVLEAHRLGRRAGSWGGGDDPPTLIGTVVESTDPRVAPASRCDIQLAQRGRRCEVRITCGEHTVADEAGECGTGPGDIDPLRTANVALPSEDGLMDVGDAAAPRLRLTTRPGWRSP